MKLIFWHWKRLSQSNVHIANKIEQENNVECDFVLYTLSGKYTITITRNENNKNNKKNV